MRKKLEFMRDRIEAVLALHETPARVTGGTVTPRWVRFQVLPAVGNKISSIKGLGEELVADLDNAGICTGKTYWRKDNGNSPKLYANHNVNQTCPIHGDPPANGRLRVYIGLDPVRQAEAVDAIERRGKKAELQKQVGQIEAQLSRIERAITDAYYAASNQQQWEW